MVVPIRPTTGTCLVWTTVIGAWIFKNNLKRGLIITGLTRISKKLCSAILLQYYIFTLQAARCTDFNNSAANRDNNETFYSRSVRRWDEADMLDNIESYLSDWAMDINEQYWLFKGSATQVKHDLSQLQSVVPVAYSAIVIIIYI